MDILTVLIIMAVILFLSFLAETLTEAVFGTLQKKIPALAGFDWILMYIAMAVGVLLAWVYHFDLVYLLSEFLRSYAPTLTIPIVPITGVGITLTGLAIGRGSNYIHDLYSRFFVKPTLPAPPTG